MCVEFLYSRNFNGGVTKFCLLKYASFNCCILFNYRLREKNVKLKFVTNTTKESRRVLYERLINLGFNIDINEIWSSIWAARNAIASDALKPFLLVDKKALEDFSGDNFLIIRIQTHINTCI